MFSYEIVFVEKGIQRYIKDEVHQIRQKYLCFQKILINVDFRGRAEPPYFL
jgi:hypothetical protein